jgi:hypothetical protein
VLRDARSPAAADACYQAIIDHGIDPAVGLAFFRHESSFGTAGVAARTKGWGNIVVAALACVGAASRRTGQDGRFAAYATWADGAHDWAAYMRCRYLERGMATVESIIPIYAPSSDGNKPSAYIAAVRADVARWVAQGDPPAPPDPWAAWGLAYPLPETQREYGIPSAWLADGGRLGAALSDEIPTPWGAARIFEDGAIVWDKTTKRTRIYR